MDGLRRIVIAKGAYEDAPFTVEFVVPDNIDEEIALKRARNFATRYVALEPLQGK